MSSTTAPSHKRLPLGANVGRDRRLSARVARQLLELIEAHYSPHLRLPPIRQIADEFGISVGTANQAVKQLVSEGVLVARQRSGTVIAPGCTIEHVRQRIAGAHDNLETATLIRVLLDPVSDLMTQEMADSFARTVTNAGARVVFAEYPPKFHGELLDHEGSDATAMFQAPAHGRAIQWNGPTPLVVVGTAARDVDASGGFDEISVDDENGAYLAGRYLRTTGHRRVCYVGRHDRTVDDRVYDELAAKRLGGFERGWGEAVPETRRIYGRSHDLHGGAAAFADYVALSPRPEGVFCETDDLAIGFHIGAFTHHLRPGRDFSLIGFDKQQLGMTIPAGPLTTVEVPRQAMGARAAEVLLDRLKNPDQPVRRVALGCSLFDGNTVMR